MNAFLGSSVLQEQKTLLIKVHTFKFWVTTHRMEMDPVEAEISKQRKLDQYNISRNKTRKGEKNQSKE